MVNISNNTLSFFRFGLVVALKTLKDVKKGEEFLVNYQYPYKMGPKWYKKLFKASAKNNPAIPNQLRQSPRKQSKYPSSWHRVKATDVALA